MTASKTLISDTKIETKQDLHELISQSSHVLHITHDYYENVTPKQNVLKTSATIAKELKVIIMFSEGEIFHECEPSRTQTLIWRWFIGGGFEANWSEFPSGILRSNLRLTFHCKLLWIKRLWINWPFIWVINVHWNSNLVAIKSVPYITKIWIHLWKISGNRNRIMKQSKGNNRSVGTRFCPF